MSSPTPSLRRRGYRQSPFAVAADHEQRLVSMSGELDVATTPHLISCAEQIMATPGPITLDFAGLTVIAAAGLTATVHIRNHQLAGGEL